MPEYDNENRGVLFPNKYKEDGDKKPNYTGSVDVQGEQWRLAAWENTSKNGVKYISLVVSEPKEKEEVEEEVPF
tara:strand:+ start:286 stop:507 length:222 start_codon:yes stop_codon:yes gene_type:complete